MIDRRTFAGGVAAILAFAGSARAQTFPNRPLTWLVPYPAGGPGDLMARVVGEVLAQRQGQPVLVDNRPGAGGQIAGSALVKAEADGHTLMLGDTSTLGVNKAVFKTFSWDPVADARGVALMLVMPMVLLVPRSSPFQSLADLVAASRRKPLNYASQGPGSTGHLLGELLRDATGGQFTHVPYKGSAPAMNDLLGAQVDLLFDGIAPALPHVRADKLKVLAVAGPRRLAQLPEVPSTIELGLPGIDMSIWFGAVVRKGVPDALTRRLHSDIAAAMAQDKVSRRFTDLGFQVADMSEDKFNRYIASEAERWSKFVQSRGISAD